MKKYLIGLLVVPLMLALVSPPVKIVYSIDEVVQAVKAGNASQLSKFFDERLDLTIPGRSDNYSRVQAEMILKDFFRNVQVRDFQVKHRGMNEGAEFCFGDLITTSGNYRVMLYMKQKGDRQVLQEIGVDKTD
jgi:hypothetical protein